MRSVGLRRKILLSTAIGLAAMLAMPTAAFAATSTGTDTIATRATDFTDSIDIPMFAGCGDLSSVTVTLTATLQATINIENTGEDTLDDGLGGDVMSFSEARVSLRRPDGSEITFVLPRREYNDGILGSFDGTIDFAGTSGVSHGPFTVTESSSVVLTDPADLALFTGAGTLSLPTVADGDTGTTIGTGNLATANQTRAEVSADVTYTFGSCPQLGIDKIPGADSVAVGDVLPYTLNVSNTGEDASINTIIHEVVPVGTTFNAAASTAGWSCADGAPEGTECELSLGRIAGNGGTAAANFAVNVVSDQVSVASVENNVSVTGTGEDTGIPVEGTDETDTPIKRPALDVVKDDLGVTAFEGESYPYLITVDNTGDADASGVVVTETVPVGGRFDAAASSPGWSCGDGAAAGAVCTMNVGTITPAQEPVLLFFAVEVVAPLAESQTSLVNTVSARSVEGATDEDTEDTPVPAPAYELTKVAVPEGAVDANGVIVYDLALRNVGGRIGHGVTLHETVPVGTTFEEDGSSANWTCGDGAAAGTVCTLFIGDLAPDALVNRTFAVRVNGSLAAGQTRIDNVATVRDNIDPTVDDDSDDATNPLRGVEPTYTITKSDGGVSAVAGQTVTYDIDVTNVGAQAGTGVQLRETVPVGSTFSAAASTAGWSCADGAVAGTECTFAVGTLAGGGGTFSANFAVRVVDSLPADLTQLDNTVRVGDDIDPPADDASDDDDTPVSGSPALALVKSDDGALASPGGVIRYSLQVTNSGTRAATPVVLSETVPVNTTFDAGASDSRWICGGVTAGSTCVLQLATLAGNGGTDSVNFAVQVVSPLSAAVTQIVNRATAGTPGLPPVGDEEDTPLSAPNLTFLKSATATVVSPGDSLEYLLTAANTGGRTVPSVRIVETVPANTTFDASNSSPGWSCADDAPAGTTCTLNIGDLAGGGSVDRTFAVQVNNPLPTGVTTVANQAVLDDGDPTTTDPSDGEETPVDAAPVLDVAKTDNGVTAEPGDTVTYTITVTNRGDTGATGVFITETVPANSTFVASASAAGWSCANGAPAGTQCVLTIGALAGGGASASRAFAVAVDDIVPAGTDRLYNSVTVSDDDTPGTPDDTDEDETPLDGVGPVLSVAKTDDGITVAPGGVIEYDVTATNDGNVAAAGVVLTETVPTNTTFTTAGSDARWSCANGAVAGTTCTLTVGALAAGGGTTTVAFAVRAVSPLPTGVTQIANRVTIQDDDNPGTVDDTDDEDTPTVVASLGDRVWYDVDSDGVQDPGEPGLVGVKVTLEGCGVSLETVTGPGGQYLFSNLAPCADYSVVVDPSTVPSGLTVATYDLDGVATPGAIADLESGENRRDVDFGFVGSARLGDTVFEDLDGDGVQDPGEPGMPGVTVTVTWAGPDGDCSTTSDNVSWSLTTGVDGFYEATDLPSGTYCVTITPPDGYGPTTPISVTTVLDPGEDDPTVDFGLRGTQSLGDRVWFDIDSDGVQDLGEPGIPGVKITAVDTCTGVVRTATTDANGTYLFENLGPCTYEVSLDSTTLPAGTIPTFDLSGPIDRVATVDLAVGDNRRDVDFGEVGAGSLGDRIWNDADDDGVQDPGEAGIPGVTVTLTSVNCLGLTRTATTDASGNYTFTGLPACEYTVTVDPATVPADLAQSGDLDSVLDNKTTVKLGAGEDRVDLDFGYSPTQILEDGNVPPGTPGTPGTGTPSNPGPSVRGASIGRLAVTGMDPALLLQVGLWSVLAGLALVLVTTRRRGAVSPSLDPRRLWMPPQSRLDQPDTALRPAELRSGETHRRVRTRLVDQSGY